MKYILVTTPKRKNARRHIAWRGNDIDDLRKSAKYINDRYVVEIYTGNWKLIERIK